MKKKCRTICIFLFILLLLPYIVTVLINGKCIHGKGDNSPFYVKVQVGERKKKILWEDYLAGVVAKEIQPEYHMEMLKVQTIITRTNLYREMEEEKDNVFSEEYMTEGEMQKLWGKEKGKEIYKKLKKAVVETEGKAILYKEKLATASFHKLSNGKTRNGNEVLGEEKYPYLRMKECPKDIENKLQFQTLELTYEEVKEYCRPFLTAVDKKEVDKPFRKSDFEIMKTDSAGYVIKVRVGNHVYAGEEFRKALKLPSSCFSFQKKKDVLKIIIKGVGHGLGLSQYTANEMAKEGKTYEEILQYFFEGTEIREVAEILLNIE
ncbi:SpoIID/LytB domain-containing protein [Faecalimonas sp.]